jgi:hypothetical protein
VARFANLFGDKRDYLRGFGYQGGASRQGWSREIAELNIGAKYKDALSEPGAWRWAWRIWRAVAVSRK